jgi:DNA invertase Pin-like site-specific DNA recombinase
VFALEASRLARNGRDWHTLLEFCALVGSLIIDEDGVYDLSCWCPHLFALGANTR